MNPNPINWGDILHDSEAFKVLQQLVGIRYTTALPNWTPSKDVEAWIYNNGSAYFLYVYANGSWHSAPLGSSFTPTEVTGTGVSIATTDTTIAQASITKVAGQNIMVVASGFVVDSGVAAFYGANYLKLYVDSDLVRYHEFSIQPQAAEADYKSLSISVVLTNSVSAGSHTIYVKARAQSAAQALVANEFGLLYA